MNKIELNKQFRNIKVKFINVPATKDEEFGYCFEPKVIKKLEKFEKLIISDLSNSNISIEVNYENPYHAIGNDWIPPSFKCAKCGIVDEVAGMIKVTIDNKEEWLCEDCFELKEVK